MPSIRGVRQLDRRVRAQIKEGKKPKFKLGVADPKLGAAIQDETSIPCVCNEFTGEVGLGLCPAELRASACMWQGSQEQPSRCRLQTRMMGSRCQV